MKTLHSLKTFALITLFSGSSLFAQEVEFFYLEGGAQYHQTGSNTVNLIDYDDPYFAFAGVDITSGSFLSLELSRPNGMDPIPYDEQDESYESENSFATLAELQAGAPAGNYSFLGQKSDGTNFQINVSVPARNLPSPTRVTNFNALQNVDPTQPITVEWEAYDPGEGDAVLQIEISYYENSTGTTYWLYEVPDERIDGLPGLVPTANSFTIPANTLKGSSSNIYNIEMEYLYLESLEDAGPDFPNAQVAVLQSAFLSIPITTSAPVKTWGGYEWVNQQGDVTTGNFLGWVNVAKAPWVYSYSLGKYLYMSEPTANAPGAWVYFRK